MIPDFEEKEENVDENIVVKLKDQKVLWIYRSLLLFIKLKFIIQIIKAIILARGKGEKKLRKNNYTTGSIVM